MTLEEQFSRLIQILQLIEKEPWTWDVAGLESRFDVSRATIERDIAILRQWGQVKRRQGKFGLAEMQFLPASFSAPEALALRLAGTAFSAQAGAVYKDALHSALRKIDVVLPQRTAAEIKKANERVSISQPVVRDFSHDVYEKLHIAIVRHHPVDITYFSRGRQEATRRRVDPYGLTFKIGAWYVVGHCHLRKGIRTFALDRIKWLRIEEAVRFRYPTDFDLQEWLAKGWQLQAGGTPTQVVLRFESGVAAWIQGGHWHPTQEIEKEPDGRILFRVTVTGYEEMLYWVLSFGANVEVLEPAPLRAAVAEAAGKMVERYGAA
jgi:predicted DNA-binding transcriptional regulator YafY